MFIYETTLGEERCLVVRNDQNQFPFVVSTLDALIAAKPTVIVTNDDVYVNGVSVSAD